MGMLQIINGHMNQNVSPTCRCIGECPGIYWDDPDEDGVVWHHAALCIWDDTFNDSSLVAKWFKDAGAQDISVNHVLYSDFNGDRDGVDPTDKSRTWYVTYRMSPDTGQDEVHRCRVCGCTDNDCSQCIERTGQPCHWVATDLCSACA